MVFQKCRSKPMYIDCNFNGLYMYMIRMTGMWYTSFWYVLKNMNPNCVRKYVWEYIISGIYFGIHSFYTLYDSSNHKSRTILIYKGFYLKVRKQTYLNLEHVLSWDGNFIALYLVDVKIITTDMFSQKEQKDLYIWK